MRNAARAAPSAAGTAEAVNMNGRDWIRRNSITSAGPANEGVDTFRFQDFTKRLDTLHWRGLVRQGLSRIVRNQINFCPQTMTIEQVRKLPRLGVRIIHAAQHHVFKGESLIRLERLFEFAAG